MGVENLLMLKGEVVIRVMTVMNCTAHDRLVVLVLLAHCIVFPWWWCVLRWLGEIMMKMQYWIFIIKSLIYIYKSVSQTH